jgi:hypothetical protein
MSSLRRAVDALWLPVAGEEHLAEDWVEKI